MQYNVVRNRELLRRRIEKELRYLMTDLVRSRRHRVQPFVVVCWQRTGSNMLRYALETHPRVIQYGEIFNDARDSIPGAFGIYAYRPHWLLQLRQNDAERFLSDVIFRGTSPAIQSVGFKLFYQHGRNAGPGNPWPVLQQRHDVRLVHLVRENPLSSFLSRERAIRSLDYVQMRNGGDTATGSQEPEKQVVDVAAFREYLQRYDADIRRFHEEFAGREILELSYERLSKDTAGSIRDVLDFIGAEQRELRLQTARQSSGSSLRRVVNLDEVADAHRGTRWASAPQRWKT